VVIFWGFIYKRLPEEMKIFSVNIGFHGVMALMIVIELYMNNIKLDMRTLQHNLIYITCYLGFNYYYTKYYEPIYPGLTWEDRKSFYFILGAFTIGFIWFLLMKFFSDRKNVKIEFEKE